MNKFEKMTIDEFNKFLNKKIILDYLQDLQNESSLKTMTGVIIECSVFPNHTYTENIVISDLVPFFCKFINEKDKQQYSFSVRSIRDISLLNK